jgi:hypothetical protein
MGRCLNKHKIDSKYNWVSDQDSWKRFLKKQIPTWKSLNDLNYGTLKEIKKMISHNVTINEMKVIVVKISDKFNLSPHDSFKLWQSKCEI